MNVLERECAEYDIDEAAWGKPKPDGISGCFRLRDEAQYMERAILSHLPFLDEAVLIVQASNDNTVEIAERLADTYEKIRTVLYPVQPRFIDHPQWNSTPENSIFSFVYMSNWALTQCRYRWIAKTEGDVIALPQAFKDLTDLARRTVTPTYFGRVILNVAGEHEDRVSYENVRNGGWDECIVPNSPAFRFVKRDKWEVLTGPGNEQQYCAGWSALHMKRCKKEFLPGTWNGEHYIPFTPEAVANACLNYNATRGAYPGADAAPLGIPELFEVLCSTDELR